MATIYRKTFTKPVPADAQISMWKGKRLAQWKDRKGKLRTATVTTGKQGSDRLRIESDTYIAKYRDGSGQIVEITTGCRSKDAAMSVLKDLTDRAEKVKARILTSAEDAVRDHQATPLAVHVQDYIRHQQARKVHKARVDATRQRIKRILADTCWARLNDLNSTALERWLLDQQVCGMSPGNSNEYRKAIIGFANWCVRNHRLVSNPLALVPMANAKSHSRRKRRALTEAELVKLLQIAKQRPLMDALIIRRGNRKGRAEAELKLETRQELECKGWERALIYKMLVLTGLRKGELASLTVGQLELDGKVAYAALHAADEKNRQGSEIALRADLAADLRAWIMSKLERLQAHARGNGDSVPIRLPTGIKLFNVPAGLLRILDRDLVMAGIARRYEKNRTMLPNGKVKIKWGIDKSDERGRTVDVHALRHTFGTLLSKGGVSPRVAQEAMRHSTIDLTMNTYTDPKLLDVIGSLDVLPDLPLSADRNECHKATGTDGMSIYAAQALAPMLAPNADKPSTSGSNADDLDRAEQALVQALDVIATLGKDRTCDSLTNPDNAGHEMERTGVEPVTSALQRQRSPN